MMQADYTRKTQALSEERKYYDNLEADLAAVKANPALASKFRSVYPEKFHGYLGYVGAAQAKAAQAQETQAGAKPSGMDPEVLARIEKMERAHQEREAAALDAEISSTFEKLSKKYPLADETTSIARAEALLANDKELKLTPQVWERIWKADQEAHEKRYKAHYSKQIQEQTTANKKGKDAASGGGIPGHAPKKPRTIKEASSFALEELQSQ